MPQSTVMSMRDRNQTNTKQIDIIELQIVKCLLNSQVPRHRLAFFEKLLEMVLQGQEAPNQLYVSKLNAHETELGPFLQDHVAASIKWRTPLKTSCPCDSQDQVVHFVRSSGIPAVDKK
jgi:hypothetical protein